MFITSHRRKLHWWTDVLHIRKSHTMIVVVKFKVQYESQSFIYNVSRRYFQQLYCSAWEILLNESWTIAYSMNVCLDCQHSLWVSSFFSFLLLSQWTGAFTHLCREIDRMVSISIIAVLVRFSYGVNEKINVIQKESLLLFLAHVFCEHVSRVRMFL